MKKTFISSSTKETIQFAKRFAQQLRPGQILALIGELGSGKTTFVKGIARGLGLLDAEKQVKSPSFVLMRIYPTKVPLYHFDLYRLEKPKDIFSIGIDDFINDKAAISCVEWADKAFSVIPPSAFHIYLKIEKKERRKITVTRFSS